MAPPRRFAVELAGAKDTPHRGRDDVDVEKEDRKKTHIVPPP